MAGIEHEGASALMAVSNAMVRLHKEQFGRGPTQARSSFSGDDVLVCVLEDVLLPAERKMIALGEEARVRDSRVAFQAATASEFIEEVESIVDRKVRAFGSAVDTGANVMFENFLFEPRAAHPGGDGTVTALEPRSS